ncbi:hypothetical protein, partial [Ferruginibacter sp.]
MKLLLSATAILAVFFASAQKEKISFAATDSILFGKVKYRQIGPFRGGRSGTVAGSYKNKNTFFFGSAGGGVWKTTDG